MKKRNWILINLAVLAVIAFAFVCRAQFLGSFFGNLVTFNGTTNGPSATYGTFFFTKTFQIQNGGLTSTNEFSASPQVSFDGSNFISIGTYSAGITNATNDIFVMQKAVTVYFRMQLVTTNTIGAGYTYQ